MAGLGQRCLAGIVDNAHRRFLHRHIKTNEMHHLIAPSSMLEVAPTSIHYRQRKGMRTHHPSLSRSRRDKPSSPNRQRPLKHGGRNWSSCPGADDFGLSSENRRPSPRGSTVVVYVCVGVIVMR